MSSPHSTAVRPLIHLTRQSRTHHQAVSSIHGRRAFSTPSNASTTSSSNPNHIPSDSTSPTPTTSSQPLVWNDFFALRTKRRYFNLTSSVLTSGASLLGGLSILSSLIATAPEQLMFFGMDPIFGFGLGGTAFLGVGWLAGPVGGGLLFRTVYRGQMDEMRIKERDFFERVKKYRVDPTSSSVQNPVPDYYGEKITSVQAYRRWLKDQRAFNKKRQGFV